MATMSRSSVLCFALCAMAFLATPSVSVKVGLALSSTSRSYYYVAPGRGAILSCDSNIHMLNNSQDRIFACEPFDAAVQHVAKALTIAADCAVATNTNFSFSDRLKGAMRKGCYDNDNGEDLYCWSSRTIKKLDKINAFKCQNEVLNVNDDVDEPGYLPPKDSVLEPVDRKLYLTEELSLENAVRELNLYETGSKKAPAHATRSVELPLSQRTQCCDSVMSECSGHKCFSVSLPSNNAYGISSSCSLACCGQQCTGVGLYTLSCCFTNTSIYTNPQCTIEPFKSSCW